MANEEICDTKINLRINKKELKEFQSLCRSAYPTMVIRALMRKWVKEQK